MYRIIVEEFNTFASADGSINENVNELYEFELPEFLDSMLTAIAPTDVPNILFLYNLVCASTCCRLSSKFSDFLKCSFSDSLDEAFEDYESRPF